TKIKSGKINGPATINGDAEVDGSLECNSLSVSGNLTIRGNLTVLGKSSITGELTVLGDARFMDKISGSGSIEVEGSMYGLKTTSLTGKTRIGDDLINDDLSLISGTFSSTNLKSTGTIRVSAKMNVDENIIAKKFECESGSVTLGGDLRAAEVYIFTQLIQEDTPEPEPGETLGDLVNNVVSVVFPSLINTVKGIFDIVPKKFSVSNNIEGDTIKIANCTVNGSIVGKDIIIGPNVIVQGEIRYSNSIELKTQSTYETIKVD
ncbi:MAG: hypothetical protein ACXAE3_11910, partial [Candidatus Kariarchaeaceae archaeon]